MRTIVLWWVWAFLGRWHRVRSLLLRGPCRVQRKRNDRTIVPRVVAQAYNDDERVSSVDESFVKAYPRHRIDLTRVVPEKQHAQVVVPFFSDWQTKRIRKQLEATYNDLQWIAKQNGLEAVCTLWRAAASSLESTSSCTLAFPDASQRVVQQWVDLINWAQEKGDPYPDSTIDVEYLLPEKETPVVRLTRRGNVHKAYSSSTMPDKAVIDKRTQSWVKRLLVKMQICPFTKSTRTSGQGLADVGVPVARIAYHTSHATSMISLMADTWEAVHEMILAGPSGTNGVSSILLAAPHFDDDFDRWIAVFALLEANVIVADLEPVIGVVCFHPKYATPDGSTFPGFGHMHSVPRLSRWIQDTSGKELKLDEVAAGGAWQRRTPHATINVLRAQQLQAAEGRRNTPQLYTENISKLLAIGNEQLYKDLQREQTLL